MYILNIDVPAHNRTDGLSDFPVKKTYLSMCAFNLSSSISEK